SLIITPLILELWGVDAVAAITERHLRGLLELNLEVVLIGTGRFLEFPPPRVYRFVMDRGIGVEIMDTPAACRTYNILAGDGRKVAAALIL
ncbi:MAG: MTH938/NDUFAF3 family protein, partial [Gammaproteobacteria bacterium]|nr:MTH938/NDUFAF3 family protein [Gammaproteobacteria bacterium]